MSRANRPFLLAGDSHHLLTATADRQQMRVKRLTVLEGAQFVRSGANTNLFRACALEDKFFSIDKHLNTGISDLNYQSAVALHNTNDRR